MNRLVQLSDVALVFNGKTPARVDQRQGGHPVLKIKDVNSLGRFAGSFESFVDHEFAARFSEKLVEVGDTLILNAAHNADYVGSKSYLAEPSVVGSLPTGEWLVVRAMQHCTDARFIHHWITSARIRQRLRDQVKGIHLYPKDVAALPVLLPSLHEQQRIAAILDKADSLRRKRLEAIRLADEFLRAAYLDLATKHPDRASVDSVLASIPNAARTGPFGSQLLVSEFTESGIPVLGIDNVVSNSFTWGARRFVSPEKYKELERYTVRPGDVMVTIMGTTGRVAIAPEDLPVCISTKHLCTLSLDQQKMRPSYLWACLRWDPEVRAQTQRESKGAIMEGWNMGIVKGLMVSKPPMEAQLKFEALLAKITQFSQNAGSAADQTDALVASLSAKYFS
ncbi:restriction endonuclease subunit S [Paucibacter sp. DJ2R-2]|uniref:restriction endonuclease subunit S n=1 Tax=Paucibacter sp. DJ2R-2 TaxID=2893558 RepID=UPI0021E4B45F|nr:restriction endonuclease subunit S [Paucibacter sp. DJ2R-2]MCV2439255.1 restriction endonuclease subunit S [Paucibacter sp. DJ2R-2]